MAWVYILECDDRSFYVGSARSLDGRLDQHSSGKGAKYTRRHAAAAVVWAAELDDVGEAYALERRLHGWSRAKKRALIEGRFDALPGLSRSKYRRSPSSDD